MTEQTATPRARDERGMTMIEVMIAIVVMSVLFAAVTSTLVLTGKQVTATKTTLGKANSTQFVVTYINRDLTSATKKSTNPAAQPVAGAPLPGTNVLQAEWTEVFGGTNPADTKSVLVSYRYVLDGVTWVLERREYRSDRKGDPLTLRGTQVLARDLAAPAPGWADGAAAPTHALDLKIGATDSKGRSPADLKMQFATGTPVVAGGQNTATGVPVRSRPTGELWYPETTTGNRCIGRVALILDTSGSVPISGGGFHLEQAAAGFIDGLADMSMTMTIIGFDRSAYQMYPGTATAFGTYFSLNDVAARTAARNRVLMLDDQDNAYDYRDAPTADGVHWQQTAVPWVNPVDGQTYYYEGGTNWEDALWHSIRDSSGNLLASNLMPTLAVFITDGVPNQKRPAVRNGVGGPAAVSAAKVAADEIRGLGIELIGVGVGTAFSSDPQAKPNMSTVIGPIEWDGRPTGGNAATADYFSGDFSQLGQILNTITSSRCIAAGAFRPVTSAGNPASGRWVFRDGPVAVVSEATVDPIAQFNFPMNATPTRWVEVQVEAPGASTGINRVECREGGVVLGADRLEYVPVWSHVGKIRLKVSLNQAVSCIVVEKP